MAPSITGVIPAVPSNFKSVTNAEFPGCRLVDLADAQSFWKREVPTPCKSCSRNQDHKVWKSIGFGPSQWSRLQFQLFSDIHNDLTERARKYQALIRLMSMTAEGMVEPNSVYSAGGYPVSTVYGGWEVTGASGNTVTCTYVTGSANPSDIQWTLLEENPHWGEPDGGTPPGIQGRWRVITFHGSIPGGRGLFKLSGNSQLSRHPGFIVRQINASKSIVVGNSFTIELDTPIGGLALTLRPGTSSPITGGITLYTIADEPWTQPRDSYPFWSAEQVQLVPTPAQTIQTLASYAIKPWESGGSFNPLAQVQVAGVWTEDADLYPRIYLDHPSGGATVTKIDLEGYVLADTLPIRITAWKQDPGTADGAIIVAQDRCARSVYDPTSSNGQADANGRYHYCSAADPLRAIGKEQFPDVDYKPACLLTKCPFFQHDRPGNPFDPALWQGLVWGVPWKLVQRFFAGILGSSDYDLSRHDVPGLAALTRAVRNCPTGYHAVVDWTLHTGGWPQFRTITQDGQDFIVHIYGLEWLEKNNSNDDPNFWSSGTWPDFGPAGDKWAKKSEGTNAAADDTSDPQKMARQRIFGGGRDIHRYRGTAVGGIGRRHRFSPEKYELWFPRLGPGTSLQEYDDGTFQRGAWDENFQAVDDSSPEKVWGARATIRRLRHDRTRNDGHGGDVGTVSVKSVELDGTGIYKFTLHNGVESASSLIGGSPGQETATQWRAGGTNVQAPEFGRVFNYASNSATVGVNRSSRVQAGHALRFTNESIDDSSWLKDRRLLIIRAKASSGTTESWRLDTSQSGQAFYDQGFYFVAYGSNEESALSFTVTRNSGATTLKAAPGPGKVYGLAKDVYQWFEGISTGGAKGVMFLFSKKNGTGGGGDADRIMSITVVTTAATYGPTAVNIETDGAMGWNTKQTFTYSSPNGETISSLDYVRARKPSGELTTLNSSGAHANWEDWLLTDYTVSGIGTASIAITVSPDWANDNIDIMCNFSTGDGLTDTQYRDQRVAIHQGIPAGYTSNANKCDEIWVTDENGALANHLTRFGADSLDDMVLPVSSVVYALPGSAELRRAKPDDGGTDTTIDAGKFVAFCASGEFFIKQDDGEAEENIYIPPEGNCLIIKANVGMDLDIPFSHEIEAVRQALEVILAGDGG